MTSRLLPAIGCALLGACGSAPSPAPGPTPSATPTPVAPATPLAIPQPSGDAREQAAYQHVADRWVPILYLCDGVAGDRVAMLTTPDTAGSATLSTYAKPDFTPRSRAVQMGSEDAGMSHIWRELRPAGGGPALGMAGSITPGVLGDMETTTLPTLSTMRVDDAETRCRWLPGARVLIVTPRRSAIVAADVDGGGYVYRSFDHDKPGQVIDEPGNGTSSTPTAEVRGGRLVSSADGREVYEFTKGPWTYRVTASADSNAPGASITVLHDGRAAGTETAAAYEMAAKRIP